MDNLRLGFIGTGAIAQAVITGMVDHGKFFGPIRVSRRSEKRSQQLAERFQNVEVVSDGQQIVDQSDWVFLSVLPGQASQVLGGLDLRSDQTIISLVAGFTVQELSRMAAPASRIHRIIPLPPIEFGVGPLPIYPPHAGICRLFGRFAHPLEIDDEKQFSGFSAASSVMAAHHRLTATVASWLQGQGVDPENAAAYASHMLHSLTRLETLGDFETLNGLAKECLTSGGLNEQVLNELETSGWFDTLVARLDRIAKRLE